MPDGSAPFDSSARTGSIPNARGDDRSGALSDARGDGHALAVKTLLGATLILLSLGGCAGYHIGPSAAILSAAGSQHRGPDLREQDPRPTHRGARDRFGHQAIPTGWDLSDRGDDQADAILKGEITRINRTPARSVRGNVLATEEFNLALRVRYSLVERSSGKVLTPPAEVTGTTSFFVGSDITSDQRQAFPLAAEQLATTIVSQLSEGW